MSIRWIKSWPLRLSMSLWPNYNAAQPRTAQPPPFWHQRILWNRMDSRIELLRFWARRNQIKVTHMVFYLFMNLGMEMATDFPSTFEEQSCMKMVGYDMTSEATNKLFNKTGLKPADVDVIELHDCFSANELLTYEALGLCPPGKVNTLIIRLLQFHKFFMKAGELVDSGDNTYGGKFVVNPSGGLISKGHPLGATGNILRFDYVINKDICRVFRLSVHHEFKRWTLHIRYLGIFALQDWPNAPSSVCNWEVRLTKDK